MWEALTVRKNPVEQGTKRCPKRRSATLFQQLSRKSNCNSFVTFLVHLHKKGYFLTYCPPSTR